MSYLIHYLVKHKYRFILILLILPISIGLQLLGPQVLGNFIDQAVKGIPLNQLLNIAFIFLGITLLNQVSITVITYLSEDLAWRTTNKLRLDLFSHVMRLDMGFHNSNTPSVMMEQIDSDVTVLVTFFSQMIIQVIGNSILLIGITTWFFFQSVQMGLGLLAFVIVILFVLRNLSNVAAAEWTEFRQSRDKLYSFIGEQLMGIEDIRSRGAESYVTRQLYVLMRDLLVTKRVANFRGTFILSAIAMAFGLGTMFVFLFGANLYVLGTITIGTVYLAYRYMEMLRTPLEQISRQLEYRQQALASAKRVKSLLSQKPKIQDGTGGYFSSGTLSLEFKHVTFSYNQGQNNLHDISFYLKAGRTMGLVGRTGSGKTTLTRLILRLYEVDTGAIELGSTDIRTVPVYELRRKIGMITQDVEIFHATVRDNITLFDRSIADEHIVKTLVDLGLNNWFYSLPDGLDTTIAKGAIEMSAGEAQLLSLARVLFQKPSLIILDEASARLDPITEKIAQRTIARLLSQCTAIIIAHRLETLQNVDDIMVLEDGQIHEFGERHTLSRDHNSKYYQLLKTHEKELFV
ncbi:MAG: ABC transporter ATP-binding protein/permease [Chloroflexi bacterium]|nr:ABC transporter ATP-binding protein/permease [Chloroflexota bacterium]